MMLLLEQMTLVQGKIEDRLHLKKVPIDRKKHRISVKMTILLFEEFLSSFLITSPRVLTSFISAADSICEML